MWVILYEGTPETKNTVAPFIVLQISKHEIGNLLRRNNLLDMEMHIY